MTSAEMVFDIEYNQSDIGVVMAAREGLRLLDVSANISSARRERVMQLAEKIDIAHHTESFVGFNRTEVIEMVMAIDENAGYEMGQSAKMVGAYAIFSGMAKVAELRRHELTDFVRSVQT